MNTCYTSELKLVGVAGDSAGIFLKLWSGESKFSIIILNYDNTNSDTLSSQENFPRKNIQYEVGVYVLTISPSTNLDKLLVHIKVSPRWNYMAPFLIVNVPSPSGMEDDCSKGFETLWAAWKMNVINAKFICLHPTKGRLIFSYNPFMPIAPGPWKLNSTHRDPENGHLGSLFFRKYQEDSIICKEIDFDKTLDLGGFEIRATVKEVDMLWYPNFIKNATGFDAYHGWGVELPKILFRKLNATVKLQMYPLDYPLGIVDDQGNSDGALADVVTGISDILLISRYDDTISSLPTTYMHWEAGLSVMTQFSGELSQLEKIASVMDYPTRLGIFFVVLISLLFFKYFLRESIVRAVLNVNRIILSFPASTRPKNLVAKIYFGSLLIFATMIFIIFVGEMGSVLTKRVSLRDVKTLQDLDDLKYTVYIYKSYRKYLDNTYFNGCVVYIDSLNCTKHVQTDTKAACIQDQRLLIEIAAQLKLHLSDQIFKTHSVYVIRYDWPLRNRLNVILQRLVEASIVSHVYMKGLQTTLDKFRYHEKTNGDDEDFKVLTMNDLGFVFSILGMGLTLATISLIVERKVHQVRTRIVLRQMRRRFRKKINDTLDMFKIL